MLCVLLSSLISIVYACNLLVIWTLWKYWSGVIVLLESGVQITRSKKFLFFSENLGVRIIRLSELIEEIR